MCRSANRIGKAGKESTMTDFLQDEVRSGFYIPTAIKQAWAVQLKILSEIDRICSKYNLRYFADWGTYLGAVRHGGFVPWDDDLDICMLREDYDRFKQAAKSELPKEYTIHNFETKENHWLFLARVVNADSICFDKKHLDENYNFPYIATVDIFVLDYLYEDEEEEKKRCDEVKYIIAVADGIVNGSYSVTVTEKILGELEKKYRLPQALNSAGDRREIGVALYRLAEKQMGRTPKDKSNRIGQIFPWVLKGGRGLPKEYYDKTIRLPFEFTTIPVPAYYNKGLLGRYGEYMTVRKIWGGHDYPYFEKQRANLQAVADFKLPEFSFSSDMLRENQAAIDKSGSLKNMAGECLKELQTMVDGISEKIQLAEWEDALQLLTNCQQLAVDLGTLTEEVKGEKRKSTAAVVGSLETFCEALYSQYAALSTGAGAVIDGLKDSFDIVKENIERYIINRKEALFVSTGENRWSGFRALYEQAIEAGDTDVYVVVVPVMQKDTYGCIISSDDEAADCGFEYEDWKTFSLELHMPDVIFIQDGYDRENPCLAIPEMYYAENLQRYTDKLVFVPPFTVNEFKREDSTDWYNMKHYVTVPGVVRADVVLVQSENMKQNYVERLTEFAGEGSRKIWEQRVINYNKDSDSAAPGCKKKRMLYCIGLNEIFEHSKDILEKVENRLDIMKKQSDKLDVLVCLYPSDEAVWMEAEPGISQRLLNTIRLETEKNDKLIYKRMQMRTDGVKTSVKSGQQAEAVQNILDSCDAYYGSPTPYAHYFNFRSKPVMLCDYSN
jgi:phosphorylcholine metabolism protein LicD